ncbi:MAG: Crp/Fnr family transcriptional regulator [Chitinophagaceae bacterium]|nr:MAG: Crp/Fnr family transcriptional regulator [Chitinophagaceae bacterium]
MSPNVPRLRRYFTRNPMQPLTDTDIILEAYRAALAARAPLPAGDWALLRPLLEVVAVPRGGGTLREGSVCRFIDHVHQGAFRAWHHRDGLEVSTGLYTEGDLVTDMASLSTGAPAATTLEAVEDAVVVRLYKERLTDAYRHSTGLQALGRALLEAMVAAEQAWRPLQTMYDAAERYRFLQQQAPGWMARFPVAYIASFLGMRRETLSRLRGRRG